MKEVNWELSQEFLFGANANDVVSYIMGSDGWQKDQMFWTEKDITDGQFVIRLNLSVRPGIKALYSIGIMGGIQPGAGIVFDLNQSRWLTSPTTELGEIALYQSKAGECLARLYLEANPRRLGSDHTSLWHITPQLIGIYWNRLINEWLQPADNPTGKKDPFYIPPDLPEELHDLWLGTRMRREAARLSVAWNKAEADYREAMKTSRPVNPLPDEETSAELPYIEQKIKSVYDLLVTQGELHPTDEVIAARLPIGRKGQPYTRETVNRYRNKMRRRGIEV